MAENSEPARPKRRLMLKLTFSLVTAALFFFVVEGCCNTMIVVRDIMREPSFAREGHTEYDPNLGWRNIPGAHVKAIYGPNRDLTINQQGFRASYEFEKRIPEDRVRIVCSGDSFTLGYGVGDQATWVSQLTRVDPRIETINMGQGGYGIGQAYLWYEQEKSRFDHDVQIFAFISRDFARISNTTFLGYGKPVLRVEAEKLQVTNVPAPAHAFRMDRLAPNAARLRRLSSVRVVRRALFGAEPVPSQKEVETHGLQVAKHVFLDLQQQHQRKASSLVLLYIPLPADHRSPPNPYRAFVTEFAKQHNVPLIDLTIDLDELSPADMQGLYEDHFNEQGYAWVAERVYANLTQFPQIAKKLPPPAAQ